MNRTYLSYNNIISSLGFNSEVVVDAIQKGKSGLDIINDDAYLNQPFCSSIVSSEKIDRKFKNLNEPKNFTKLEKMMILSLNKSIGDSGIELDNSTGLIISTTKGNIDVLSNDSNFKKERAYLSSIGQVLTDFFGFSNEPIIVSNACVTGLLSLGIAKKFIEQGLYKNIFIVAGDLVTNFVLSGFQSFQALSSEPCKPYSKYRKGINIGEVAVSVLVTSDQNKVIPPSVELLGESSCNDANHISGPSRSGEGLYRAIRSALKEAKIEINEIDYISAHGTATIYNDEMESVAFNRLGLDKVPVNSYKGYFGHTLGASGLLETVIGMHGLHRNMLYASKGFDEIGLTHALNVIKKTASKPLQVFLKTSSGFGGSNTAMVFKKIV